MSSTNFYPNELPKGQDKLFMSGSQDWINNAVLNYTYDKFFPYADGYKEGAEKLVIDCIKGDGTKDILIYPIVFLYRQYIELRLKEIIIGLHYCLGEGNDFPKHHRIDKIWDEMVELYKRLGEDTSGEDFKNGQRLIYEFATSDPLSMTFRYPVDKEGNEHVKQTHINIRNVGEVMSRLGFFIDAISYQIAHYTDIASEMYVDLYSREY